MVLIINMIDNPISLVYSSYLDQLRVRTWRAF